MSRKSIFTVAGGAALGLLFAAGILWVELLAAEAEYVEEQEPVSPKATQGVTIATDPDVIPMGTEVEIDGHIYIAQDVGGAISGNRIDLYFDSHEDALQWGVQEKIVRWSE